MSYCLIAIIFFSFLLLPSCTPNEEENDTFTDEFLDLSSTELPLCWELIVTSGDVKVEDGKLTATPVDAFGFLRRTGIMPEPVTEIKLEWDGNLAYSNWGMLNILQLNYTNDNNIAIYLETAGAWSSDFNYLILQHNYNTSGTEELKKQTVPLQYGEFHYIVTVTNTSIKFDCKNIETQIEYINKIMDIPSDINFNLQSIKSIDFITYTTTDNPNWIDNISIGLNE